MSFFLYTASIAVAFISGSVRGSLVHNTYGNCISTTDAVYTLPDRDLTVLNPWLKNDSDYRSLRVAGCRHGRDKGTVCHDKPSIGSGFAQLYPNYFLGLTDHGPSQDCAQLYKTDPVHYASAKGKHGTGFPIQKFAPTIVHIAHDPSSRELITKRYVPLLGKDGRPISGLPNTQGDETPYGADCRGKPLAYDPSGLDTEDLARIPGTDYVAIVDEYAPSVVIADFKTGSILVRHVPISLKDALSKARYNIVADIPNVYRNRRKNRGFEAIVVDKKGKYVIAIMQSPMLGDNKKKTENNAIIRCAYFKLKVSKTGKPKLSYSKTFVIEASSPAAYVDSENEPQDLKYSAAQYHSTGKFIVLERAKGQVKLFHVNFLKATNIDNTRFANNLHLEIETNGLLLAKQVNVIAAEKTLIWDTVPGIGGSKDYGGCSKMGGFVIDMSDASKVWMIEDNDFGMQKRENVDLFQFSLGRMATGATVCKIPDHPMAPEMNVDPALTIYLSNQRTYRVSDEPGVGATKTLTVEEEKERAYVINHSTGSVDMYDAASKPPKPLQSYSMETPYGPTSVDTCKDGEFLAIGVANEEDEEQAGRVDILTKGLKLLRRIKHSQCIGVTDVKWSDDCKFITAACEGVGASVPGGVLVIDFGGPKARRFRNVKMADFMAFDEIANIVTENGVRLIESHKPSMDFEPKRLVIDGKHAFVTLQENNAIAVVDLHEAKVTEVKPIGYIERQRSGFGLDASDVDGMVKISNYPFLYGMPQPDGIQKYVAGNGQTYLVFANEGAAKIDVEEGRGFDITKKDKLDRKAVPGLKEMVENRRMLGRLKFSTIMGYNKSTNTQEKMFHFGGRSFSIMSLDGMIVFDSGEWFARIQEKISKTFFNSDAIDIDDMSLSQKDLFDSR